MSRDVRLYLEGKDTSSKMRANTQVRPYIKPKAALRGTPLLRARHAVPLHNPPAADALRVGLLFITMGVIRRRRTPLHKTEGRASRYVFSYILLCLSMAVPELFLSTRS